MSLESCSLPSPQPSNPPTGGLWAYHRGHLLTYPFQSKAPKMDHVQWFRDIGLPDFGLGFDRILRGRMIWDLDRAIFVLSFYDTMHLPNHVYQKVNRAFNPDGAEVMEKPLSTHWVNTF